MAIYFNNNSEDLLSSIRRVVNEINVGGKDIDNENDDDNDNFMDDGGDDDTATDDNTTDDSSDDVGAGESDNFMDDSGEGGDDTATDDAGGEDDDVGAGESDNFMDDGGDDTTDDTGGDDSSDDVGDGESDNFMDDGGDDSGDSESTEGDGEATDDSDAEGDAGEEDEDYDLDKIEDELFSSLTPEQIAIKNHELKNQFIEVYSIIGSTLVRINDIPKSNDNINILKFVTEKLLELREMVDYNITVAYATRTYIENNIIYQQCIATLNAIADIIDNIPNVNGGESNIEKEKEETEKEDEKGVPVEPDDTQQVKSLDVSDSSMSDYQEESTDYNSLF